LAPLTGSRVLDVGTGTGILAVAALKVGAVRAVGVDIDPRAAATARHAARLNGQSEHCSVVLGSLDALRPSSYDVVLANLHGDVLLELSAAIVGNARPGAAIVLSGIAWEWAYQVREEYLSRGCGVLRERWLEEYVTVCLRAPRD
jgi:ribosomal protein L11 methyltransferase